MATSAVPNAVDALVDILTLAAASEAIRVSDGPPTVDVSLGDLLFVGWSPDSDIVVEQQQDFANAGARRRDETFTVTCYAESRSGSLDMRARRRRVYDIAALIETALRATDAAPLAPTLNGTVLWAQLTTGSLRQIQTPDACTAGLTITIACHARL
jgi:hypothetical protein